MEALLRYTERVTRAALAAVPAGSYTFDDALDGDGESDEPVPLRVTLTFDGSGSLHCDFTGSSAQRRGSINAVASVTRSAVYYVVRCLLEPDTPTNDGCFRPVTFTLPEGSVVNAVWPTAVTVPTAPE